MKLPQDFKHILPFHIRPPLRLRIGDWGSACFPNWISTSAIEFGHTNITLWDTDITKLPLQNLQYTWKPTTHLYDKKLPHVAPFFSKPSVVPKKSTPNQSLSYFSSQQKASWLSAAAKAQLFHFFTWGFSRSQCPSSCRLVWTSRRGQGNAGEANGKWGGVGVRFGVMKQTSEKVHPRSLT